MFDLGASTSVSMFSEHLRIIRNLTTEIPATKERGRKLEADLARHQCLIDIVFNHVGMLIPPPESQQPEHDGADQNQPPKQDNNDDEDEGHSGDSPYREDY